MIWVFQIFECMFNKRLTIIGFNNINIDLMFALPNQSLEDWEESLNKIIRLRPEHISKYSLIVEEGTKFYDWYNGKEDLFDEEIRFPNFTLSSWATRGTLGHGRGFMVSIGWKF